MNTKKLLLIALVMGLGAGSASASAIASGDVETIIANANAKAEGLGKKPVSRNIAKSFPELATLMQNAVVAPDSKGAGGSVADLNDLKTTLKDSIQTLADVEALNAFFKLVQPETSFTEAVNLKKNATAEVDQWYKAKQAASKTLFQDELARTKAMFNKGVPKDDQPSLDFASKVTQSKLRKYLTDSDLKTMNKQQTISEPMDIQTVRAWGITEGAQELVNDYNKMIKEMDRKTDVISTLLIALERKSSLSNADKLKVNNMIARQEPMVALMDHLLTRLDATKANYDLATINASKVRYIGADEAIAVTGAKRDKAGLAETVNNLQTINLSLPNKIK